MATFPSEFIDLAAELIDDEFTAFKRDFTMIKNIGYDPITDTDTEFREVIGAIPIDLKTAENIFTSVTADRKYIVLRNTAPVPSDFDASYHCEYDGKAYEIEDTLGDPAGAAIFVSLKI